MAMKVLKRQDAYIVKDNNYRKMVSIIKDIKAGKKENQLIFIDGIYIRIFLYDIYNPYESAFIKAWTTNDLVDPDLCITIYDHFFNIKDMNCQMVMIAHEIGHYKTINLRVPQYGYQRTRREYLRRGDVSPDELAADRYARSVLSCNYREALFKIASYIDDYIDFHPDASREVRIRASKIYK